MKKDVTLLEAIAMGGNAYDLLGVDRETKRLKKRISKDNVVTNITPISKPSDRFDIEDYMLYEEYMITNGGTPSIEDYFKAIEYFKSRA